MIRSFKCRETQLVFLLEGSRNLRREIQQVAARKLKMLNRAISITDQRAPPANRLDKLHGSRERQWSIRVNDQWRICFAWRDGHAYNVEIVDYR